MKRIILSAVLCAFPLVAFGQDARISYYNSSGGLSRTTLVSSSCGTDAAGIPILCGTDDTDARIRYQGLDGFTHTTDLVTPVCGVDDAGIPQICTSSGSSSSSPALVLNSSDLPTSAGTWPTVDPLTAGQAWVNGGVMMLSTGSAAKPTFDGSGLQNVAVLDSSGRVTDPIYSSSAAQTGALQVNGQINAQGIGYFVNSSAQIQGLISNNSRKWILSRRPQDTYTQLSSYNGSSWQSFGFNDDGTIDSSAGIFANLGTAAPFTVSVSAPVITATTSASVPDTATTDSSTAALNTESASSRFLSQTDAASTYALASSLTNYITSDTAAATYATLTSLDGYLTSSKAASTYVAASVLANYLTTDSAASTYAPLASPALTGTPTVPTATVGTTATSQIANVGYVSAAFSSIEYSVTGDISTSGSSISIPFGDSGLKATFAYTGSGSASMTFYATSATLSPVDIRRNSIWGSSGVETYTLDNGSVTTSGVVADSTVYTNSQDSSAYFIRVGGNVYFLTVWASNNGARAFMGVHKMI